jgi:hypothetical protein
MPDLAELSFDLARQWAQDGDATDGYDDSAGGRR